jgi:hypothetical protein
LLQDFTRPLVIHNTQNVEIQGNITDGEVTQMTNHQTASEPKLPNRREQ